MQKKLRVLEHVLSNAIQVFIVFSSSSYNIFARMKKVTFFTFSNFERSKNSLESATFVP